jgi:hypothetical protein
MKPPRFTLNDLPKYSKTLKINHVKFESLFKGKYFKQPTVAISNGETS